MGLHLDVMEALHHDMYTHTAVGAQSRSRINADSQGGVCVYVCVFLLPQRVFNEILIHFCITAPSYLSYNTNL